MKTNILIFFCLLLLGFSNYGFTQCGSDWNALHHLYNNTNGNSWADNSGWAQVSH